MQIIKKPIPLKKLQSLTKARFGNLVKAVVDVEEKIMVIDAELHADEEAKLLENGSKQVNLWGINLYPEKIGSSEFIEFDSVINLRPSQKNLSRGVDNPTIQRKIREIVDQLVTK